MEERAWGGNIVHASGTVPSPLPHLSRDISSMAPSRCCPSMILDRTTWNRHHGDGHHGDGHHDSIRFPFININAFHLVRCRWLRTSGMPWGMATFSYSSTRLFAITYYNHEALVHARGERMVLNVVPLPSSPIFSCSGLSCSLLFFPILPMRTSSVGSSPGSPSVTILMLPGQPGTLDLALSDLITMQNTGAAAPIATAANQRT